MTARPLHPWEIRRAAERASIEAAGQEILTRAIRKLPLTTEERAEAERLIALPYGAEGNGLQLFLLAMSELREERRYDCRFASAVA